MSKCFPFSILSGLSRQTENQRIHIYAKEIRHQRPEIKSRAAIFCGQLNRYQYNIKRRERGSMKKVLCLLGIASIILAGCGKQDTANKTQKVSIKDEQQVVLNDKSSKSDTINVVFQDDVTTKKWFKYAKKAYEEAYPGKKVNLIIISGTPQQYYTKLMMMLKTDSSIDVVYEDSFMLHSDINAGYFSPINGIKKWSQWEKFYPSLRDFATFNEDIYGVPISTDVRLLFYNVDMFKKAGIKTPWQPENWQDIIDACKILKAKIPDVAPITFPVSQAMGEATSMTTLEMLLFGTESPFYKDGKWVLSSPGMLNSFKFIHKLAKENYFPRMGIMMNPQYGNIMQDELAPKQQVGIILDGCWITGRWVKAHPETLNLYKPAMMPTEFGQKPGFVTLSGGWFLCINELSNKKEEGLDFIKFALNKENILKYVLTVNNLSVREDVAADPAYPEFLKAPTDMLKYTHFRPANGQYPIVSSKMSIAVESVVTQSATPEQTMKNLYNSVERILGKKSISSEND